VGSLDDLIARNRSWAAGVAERDPAFLPGLAKHQAPRYLWIGCSDSRVPPDTIAGLEPGETFVHRNVANVVVPSDLSCLSVLQYAIEYLHEREVILCGHDGCGGVHAALETERHGLVDNWLRHVQDALREHAALLGRVADPDRRLTCACELNVIEQVANLCRTTVVQDAWARGDELTVHGLVYALGDGLLRDLGITVSSPAEIDERRTAALLARERQWSELGWLDTAPAAGQAPS
jgi:carbonic anhydrase